MDRFWELVDRGDDEQCWQWLGGLDRRGRPYFSSIGGLRIHADRFAFELTRGKVEQGEILSHACGDGHCVNPDHLVRGHRQAVNGRTGRYKSGSESRNSKLTEDIVRTIRRRIADGESVQTLAAEFHVSQVTITRASTGRDWKQVE